MKPDPVFTPGQVVVATHVNGYEYKLTEGKQYTVVDYSVPYTAENGFTFPAYVTVIGDRGKEVVSHAYRFAAVEGGAA